MSPSRPPSAGALHRGMLAASIAMVVLVHLPPLVLARYANVDEAYASALAERLLEGERLYQGAISQRGPLMYTLYELFAFVVGWDNVRGLRIIALLFALGHLLMVWSIGRRWLGERVAAVATLVTAYTITLGLHPVDGLALNGEALQAPFILAGVATGATAMAGRRGPGSRRLNLVAAGLFFGCAIAIKQSAIPLPLVLLVWLAADAVRTRRGRDAAIDLAIYLAATALVPAAFLTRAALDGTLPDLWYYCVTYNLSVHRQASGRFADWFNPFYDHLRGHTAYFLLVAVAMAATIQRWWRRARLALRRRSPIVLLLGFTAADYIALTAFAALFSAASLPQHFGHYYYVPTPLLALVAATALRGSVGDARLGRASRTVLPAAATLLVAYAGVFAYQTFDDDGRVSHDKLVLTTARYIERTTRPEDKVFVWGFSPWLYGYSHRRPAGRYVFGTYVTGFVPLYWGDLAHEPARVVPGSLEALLGDLDRERPVLVVDAGSLMIARSMRAYPKAAEWLRAGYCFEARIGAADLYRRREAGTECTSPYYPCPHPPVTHWGVPLFVASPPAVDLDRSGYLGPGPADQPKGFAPDEKPVPCTP